MSDVKDSHKPSIIIMLVDALRPDKLGCYNSKVKFSPAFDQLAKKGVQFENCFTCSNASDPALTSIMSGMQTRSHGILHHSFEVNDSELKTLDGRKVLFLQEILKKNGYKTFGLDFLARWHARGYDYYPSLQIDRTKRKKTLNQLSILFGLLGLESFFKMVHSHKLFRRIFGGFQSYPSDAETTQKALEIMAENSDPYFIFMHLWGVHKPFKCPDVDNKLSVECYENSVETMNGYVEKISKAADENTVIVVFGDHGESLGEHDIYFDHHGLYDPSIHVPLIISGASVPSDKKVSGLVSLTDVFATILSLANVNYPENSESINLAPYFNRENSNIRDYIFAEENYYQDKVCVRDDQYKFIKNIGKNICELCKVSHGDEIELYDLINDPDEMHNVAEAHPEIISKMEAQADKMMQR